MPKVLSYTITAAGSLSLLILLLVAFAPLESQSFILPIVVVSIAVEYAAFFAMIAMLAKPNRSSDFQVSGVTFSRGTPANTSSLRNGVSISESSEPSHSDD